MYNLAYLYDMFIYILFSVFLMEYFRVLQYIKIFEQPAMLLFVSFAVCLKQKCFDAKLYMPKSVIVSYTRIVNISFINSL